MGITRRLNIILPSSTVRILDRVATKGNRSRFIDRAVLRYVETQGKQALRNQLKAGYSANAELDLAMAVEWFPLEEEAALKLETVAAPSVKSRVKR